MFATLITFIYLGHAVIGLIHFKMNLSSVNIYCSSDDSKSLYPDNSPSDFIVHLDETLQIPKNWVCALSDISVPSTLPDSSYFLCCDLCDSSITGGSGRHPILRRIPIPWNSVLPLVYLPVKKEFVNSLHFYLRSNTGKAVSKVEGVLECTLLLKPNTPWT